MKLASTSHLLGALAVSLALSGFAQTITINEQPRPIAHGAEELEHKYGVLINYEDPPYVSPQDIVDVTDSVARHPINHRIVGPKSGSLTLSTDLVPYGKRVTTDEAKGLVEKLLEAYKAGGNPGTFTSSQAGDVFTISPAQYRDRSGAVRDIQPILNTPISIEPQTVTILKALEILCTKINDAVGYKEIWLGMMPTYLDQDTMQLSASNQPARNVLERIVTVIGQGTSHLKSSRMVWDLFYGADIQQYVLNIHAAIQELEEPTGKGKRRVFIQ